MANYTHKLNISNVRHYTMARCENGNLCEIVGEPDGTGDSADVMVNVLRTDGSICDNFCVFLKDLEKIK